jgi:hypothetical protein
MQFNPSLNDMLSTITPRQVYDILKASDTKYYLNRKNLWELVKTKNLGVWQVHILKSQKLNEWAWTIGWTFLAGSWGAKILSSDKFKVAKDVSEALIKFQNRHNVVFKYSINYYIGSLVSSIVMEQAVFKNVAAVNYNAQEAETSPVLKDRILYVNAEDFRLSNSDPAKTVCLKMTGSFGMGLENLKRLPEDEFKKIAQANAEHQLPQAIESRRCEFQKEMDMQIETIKSKLKQAQELQFKILTNDLAAEENMLREKLAGQLNSLETAKKICGWNEKLSEIAKELGENISILIQKESERVEASTKQEIKNFWMDQRTLTKKLKSSFDAFKSETLKPIRAKL